MQGGGPSSIEVKLTASDGMSGDDFGGTVSIDGDRIIVGAAYDDGQGVDSGSAYIFDRDAGGAWVQVQPKLTAGDGAAGDLFGRVVSLDGDRAMVGAIGDVEAS